MKIIQKLFLLITIICANIAFADSDDNLSLISVTGSAELHVVPDEVHVSLMIQKDDKSLSEAQKENDEVTNSILRIMTKNLNIDKDNIKTDMINVRPVYEYTTCAYNQRDCVSTREFARFETKKSISVKLKDVDKLQKLLDMAVKAGVTHIQGVNFTSSEFKQLQNEAQVLAAIDAKQRASRIAKAMDVSIDSPYRISVDYSYDHHPKPNNNFTRSTMAMESMGSSGSSETIALGQLKIKANVNASFKIDD